MAEQQQNRRKIKSILIDSQAQLRLFVFFFILLILNSATLFLTYMAAIRFANPENASSENQMLLYEAISLVSSQTLSVGLWGFILSALVTLMFWLTLSHRIFGPSVPILRHIQKLIAGDYDTQIHLRKRDEFKDIAEHLNTLAKKLKNERGTSIVQVLISAAIISFIILVMATAQNMQAKQNAALNEKMEAIDLMRVISSGLAGSGICSNLFAPANLSPSSSPNNFNVATVASTPYVLTLRSIPGPVGSPALVSENASVPSSQNLFVPPGGIQAKVIGAKSALLTVTFDATRLHRAIHPVEVRLGLATSGPSANTVITGCEGGDRIPLTSLVPADITALPKVTDINTGAPDYQRAIAYRIPFPVKATDQYYAISALGIWDVTACGSVGPCAGLVGLTPIVAGVVQPCGSNTATGSAGATYRSVISGNVSCVVKVGAGQTATVDLLMDGRNKQTPNLDPSTYNYDGSPTTPIFRMYALP